MNEQKANYAYLDKYDILHFSQTREVDYDGGRFKKLDKPKLEACGYPGIMLPNNEGVMELKNITVYNEHECYVGGNKNSDGAKAYDTSVDYPELAKLYVDLLEM